MSFSFQSHHPVMQEGQLVGYKLTPYITIMAGGATVHVQGGQFWGGGGIVLEPEDVPSEVWDAVEKWSDEARKSVGFEKVKRPGVPVKKAS